jgi:gamma-glutamyl-gamma-aminobutyrate hydrolase PuuD
MKPILVSQRVDVIPSYGERRDALDQRWAPFLERCGLLAVPVPNDAAISLPLAHAVSPVGILFTGGNDVPAIGSDAPERDATEDALLAWARQHACPVMGVCRGMQFIAARLGGTLTKVGGHIATRHIVSFVDHTDEVNSYHGVAVKTLGPQCSPIAVDGDGFIEAFRHESEPIGGIMWHPEREAPYRPKDIQLVTKFFSTGQLAFS